MKKILLIFITACLIVYFGLIFTIRGLNIFCGGFTGKECPNKWLVCDYEGDYPDAAGKCVLVCDFLRFLK